MVTKYNYGFDWRRFVNLMLPFHLRIKGIKSLFSPAFKVLQEAILSPFSLARDNDNFKVTHNSQVVYLQLALNKKFKSSLNGVCFRVGNVGEKAEVTYVVEEKTRYNEHPFLQLEEKGKAKNHIRAINEVSLHSANAFVVYVPSDLYNSRLVEIKRFVNDYRLVTRVPIYESVNS